MALGLTPEESASPEFLGRAELAGRSPPSITFVEGCATGGSIGIGLCAFRAMSGISRLSVLQL